MIARRCCCSAISVLFQTTRPRSVLVSHKQKNSSLLSSIDRSHFFFFVFFFFERFFLYQNRENTTVLQKPFFSSVPFSRNHTSSIDCCFVCSRQKKKKIFRLKICPRGLPSSSLQPHIYKISGNRCVFCGAEIFGSLSCIKLKLLKEYSLIHAHAPYHKKETSSGDTPPFDL